MSDTITTTSYAACDLPIALVNLCVGLGLTMTVTANGEVRICHLEYADDGAITGVDTFCGSGMDAALWLRRLALKYTAPVAAGGAA